MASTKDRAAQATSNAQDGAVKAQDSKAVHLSAKLGVVAYGIVHLLIGWLALQLALGDSSGAADSQGALKQLAETPLGTPLLWMLVVGFIALVIWQIAEAISPEEEDAAKRQLARGLSIAKAVLYAVLAFSSARAAAGDRSSGGGSTEESLTAELMKQPAGQWLVAAVGLVIFGVGAALIYRGWTEGFREHLDRSAGGQSGRAVIKLGKFGYIAKGVALAVLGVLVVAAAVEHDPKQSGGLDDALHTLLEQPFGAPLVVAVGIGFAAYGIFCFARARDLKPGKG